MSPQRLQVDRGSAGPTVIAGVDAPLRGTGRGHSIAQVLDLALREAGLSLGYDALMGITGLAFRVPAWPGAAGLTGDETAAAVRALDDALRGDVVLHEAPETDAAMDIVRRSIDAGVPVAALGWGSAKESWSVICGYDTDRGRWLGHCVLDAPRKQYESWPPTHEMLVELPRSPRPRGREALRQAVRRAGASWSDSGERRYERWITELRETEEPPGIDHEVAVELVIDARTAAVGFLRRLAELEEPIPGAWLELAADRHLEAMELLESRGRPQSEAAMARLETRRGREMEADLLARALRSEQKAFRALRLALEADYPPDEADVL